MLATLFELRADPAIAETDRFARTQTIQAQIHEALEAVENLDEDRILRGFLLLIEKTLRTNYFQRDADGQPKSYLSIKLASHDIDLLPLPRPLVEIFVYSPRMEGCHLRGGKVARGGIRWSDRKEDFRTEVLGLMKAQMVKNAVIVPIGSKGGFVVKRPPETGGRDAMMAEGIACYKNLMNGLLDLTDNLVDGAVVRPPMSRAMTPTIPISLSPPTRVRRRSPTSPTASHSRYAASGWVMPSRPAAPPVTTIKKWAITATRCMGFRHAPFQRNGHRHSPRPIFLASPVSATWRATYSATA